MSKDTQHIIDVSLEDFDQQVLQRSAEVPVIVDFWADWCSPCIYIAPALKKVVQAHDGGLMLAKLEVDEGENMKLAGRYKVRGFPTVILIQNGEERGRFSGARPAHEIEKFLTQHLA
jgi:putative thioredoxin